MFENQQMANYLSLLAAAKTADQRSQIEAEIWQQFGHQRAVLVTDMSGFTRTSLEFGVLHYLSMIRCLHEIITPIVAQYGGCLIKKQADNCYCIFDDAEPALTATLELNSALTRYNDGLNKHAQIHVCSGIDYGQILLIDNRDFFGNPVNRASKLGEDVAGRGDVLLTSEAWQRVTEPEQYASSIVRHAAFDFDGFAVSVKRKTSVL